MPLRWTESGHISSRPAGSPAEARPWEANTAPTSDYPEASSWRLTATGPRVSPTSRNPTYPADGYGTPFWKAGSLNYADINVEINKKLTRSFSLTLFYMFQKFNQKVVWGHADNGDMVNSHIAVVEGQWKIKRNTQLRFEAQYLHTKQDMGDWLAATIELSLAPHWMFTITDMQNFTGDNIVDPEYKKNKNYYSFGVTYSYLRNRFYVAYGRTREGYNCSGGICRWVPASKGFTITYNYTF